MATTIKIHIADGENLDSQVDLHPDAAWALAQFVKRCSWTTCERLSAGGNDQQETQLMINAICVLQRALKDAGYAPR